MKRNDKIPSEGLSEDLDTYFKTGGTFHRLRKEIIDARKRSLIPSGFRPLTEAEQETTHLNSFAPVLVPGLLQTEEYARLVLRAVHRPEKAEELATLRMERQTVLAKQDPPWLLFLLREAAVRDIPKEVREEQCKRLLDVSSESNFSIQVIPSRAHVFQGCGFQILSFKESADIAYVDGANGHGQILTKPSDVRGLTILFSMIRSTALPVEDSENLIRTIMEGT